jgi:hypothetical protein
MSQAGMSGNVGGGGRIISSISTFNPNGVIQLFDDFFAQNGVGTAAPGQLEWHIVQGGGISSSTTVSSSHPGIVVISDSTVGGIYLSDSSGGTAGKNFILGGGPLSSNFVVDLVTLSVAGNRYTARIGMTNDSSGGAIAEGVYFTYSDNVNSGNWVINCTSGSVTTSVNTSVAATTGFHTYSVVVNAGATSVSFYIDNTLVGTAITTNIPTLVINPYYVLVRSSGALPASQIDLFWLYQTLTTPRPGAVQSSTIIGTGMLIEQYVQTAVSYQVLNTDAIVGVSSTAAPRTLTMPASSLVTGQRWTFKDESGGAAANNITISGNGKNIDGAATYVITTNYGSVDVYYNGSQFYII